MEEFENQEFVITSTSLETKKEEEFEITLRPKSMSDYIGQELIKENVIISIEAAKKRSEPVEHIMLYGPPGLGKTTLAHIIANEMAVGIRITSGPAIERSGDLAAILTNLSPGDVLFIDEIHRLNRNIEEVLYPAMEDYALDLVLGKGPSARTMRIDLPRFTLIGATTKVGSLSSPLRDRFGSIHRLEFYNERELEKIVKRTSKLLEVEIDEEGLSEIARRARKTPRIANRILRRVRDYALVKHEGHITRDIACKALDKIEIDNIGLNKTDRDYLLCIIDKFKGGPVGLDTLAAATSEDKDTIEDVIEPYLLQLGFIDRTKKGRIATPLAFEHLKISPVESKQEKLI